jgi:hypothetical protein
LAFLVPLGLSPTAGLISYRSAYLVPLDQVRDRPFAGVREYGVEDAFELPGRPLGADEHVLGREQDVAA